MVHASLRALGPIDGRAEALVRTVLSVLGNQGTLVAYVDFEPTPDIPYFDPQRSPASQEFGFLVEVIRTWPGAVRSLNPGASIVAIGTQAEWLCHGHPINYGYGPGSPFSKLVEIGGKILLLGSDLNNVTILHYAEHCARLPNKRVIQRTDRMLVDETVVDVDIEEFDTSELVIDAMPTDYFAQITQEFVEARICSDWQGRQCILNSSPSARICILCDRKNGTRIWWVSGSISAGHSSTLLVGINF